MIFIWVCIIFFGILGIGGAVMSVLTGKDKMTKYGGAIACLLVAGMICFGLHWWLYDTESGERAQKNFKSQTSGGLYRIVKVYDMQGEQIAEYKGKFDVAEDHLDGVTKIKFDADGKRHIIYSSTGTVIIDEIGEEKDD